MPTRTLDTKVITLVVVDDNPTFRSCLARMFRAEPDLLLLTSVATGQEALDLPAELRPDIVLLDVHLPDSFGISLIGPLIEHWPNCQVIVLTFEDTPAYCSAALAAGATDLVVKSRAAMDLVPSITKAMAHGN
jgi:DNA-binding NarL/FixJ family response regulator